MTRPPTPKRKPDEPPNRPNATPAATRSRNTPPHQQTSAWHGSTAISTASNATSSSKPRPGSDSCRSSTPSPNGFTDALTSWNEHSGSRKEYEKISGIAAEDAPTAARISLQTADWPMEAVTILAARIEWFIDPTDWTTVNDTSRRIPGYYQILQDLGYTPADDETSHLDQLAAAISEADENEEDEENNQ